MDSTPGNPQRPLDADSMDLVAQTRHLRRKVTFWRRMAWMIFGAAAVFGIVFWNRGETRRRECRDTLEHYAEFAAQAKLGNQRPELLELQWNQFEQPVPGSSPVHYDLILHKWSAVPVPGEKIPLAVCRDRHITTLSIGRHVLMNTDKGYRVVWMNEAEAETILRDARRDNPRR